MPKRKRGEDSGGAGEKGAHEGAKAQRVRYKIQQGTVKLGHAFKVAKGFERQKSGRRQKNAIAQSNQKDVQRINGEITALKTLDTSACARVYLSRLLNKIKAVAESPHLPADMRKSVTLSMDTAVLNVHARLCNSNPVKEAVPAILADIQGALGVKVNALPVKKKKQAGEIVADGSLAKKASKSKAKLAERDEPAELSVSEDEDDESGGVVLGDEDSDDGFQRFGDRLASSDEDEDEEEDVGAIERQLESEGIARKALKPIRPPYNHSADLNLSEDDDESGSTTAEPQKTRAPTITTLIPSLSMGGYISGSGSDIDDDIDVAPRKNRRGQRARQQIWEKKFGQKAVHLQKQQRDRGWDSKRGATDSSERRGKGKALDEADRSAKRRDPNARASAVGMPSAGDAKVNHRDDGGPIHPSWEAAKKAKERKAAAPIAFQGKKISFE